MIDDGTAFQHLRVRAGDESSLLWTVEVARTMFAGGFELVKLQEIVTPEPSFLDEPHSAHRLADS